MTQLELLFTIEEIEAKRDEAMGFVNHTRSLIQQFGASAFREFLLERKLGEVKAYDDSLALMRSFVIEETLKEWRKNA